MGMPGIQLSETMEKRKFILPINFLDRFRKLKIYK
jgi:hypothetical protein